MYLKKLITSFIKIQRESILQQDLTAHTLSHANHPASWLLGSLGPLVPGVSRVGLPPSWPKWSERFL